MRQGAKGRYTRTTLKDGMGREMGGEFRMGVDEKPGIRRVLMTR